MLQENKTTSEQVIDDFVRKFDRRANSKLAGSVQRNCKALLRDAEPKILANYSYRAKHRDSLRNKLDKENKKLQKSRNGIGFRDNNDILDTIFDLAGVRIAVFFPGQQKQVEKILEKEFDKEDRIHSIVYHNVQTEQEIEVNRRAHDYWNPFSTNVSTRSSEDLIDRERSGDGPAEGYIRRFQGYTAKHYRLWTKTPSLTATDSDSSEESIESRSIVEIQVVTALMIAWAQVEHDIIYKKIFGDPSGEESRLLDCLRGTTITGDLILEQLGKAYFDRIEAPKKKFSDVGALLSLLDQRKLTAGKSQDSHAEALLGLLQIFNKDTPERLEKYLEKLKDPSSIPKRMEPQLRRSRVSPTLCIMINVFEEERVNIAATIEKQRTLESGSEDTYRCKVLMSCLLWLISDLFTPPVRVEELLDGLVKEMKRDGKVFVSLAWAIQGVGRFDIVCGEPPKEFERQHIQNLWQWFEQCEEPIMSFVFVLSRLGIQRLKRPEQVVQIGKHKIYSDCLRIDISSQQEQRAEAKEDDDTEPREKQPEVPLYLDTMNMEAGFPEAE